MSAMPLSSCYAKPPARRGLILGYGGTDARQIHDAMRKLSTIFNKARGTPAFASAAPRL